MRSGAIVTAARPGEPLGRIHLAMRPVDIGMAVIPIDYRAMRHAMLRNSRSIVMGLLIVFASCVQPSARISLAILILVVRSTITALRICMSLVAAAGRIISVPQRDPVLSLSR